MPWNVGIVAGGGNPCDIYPRLFELTDFTGLAALPTGWSKTAGAGSVVFDSTGVGSSSGTITITDTIPSYIDQQLNSCPNSGISVLTHLHRSGSIGGPNPGFGVSYSAGTSSVHLTAIGGPGYTGSPVFMGQAAIRSENNFDTDLTMSITSPVDTTIRDLWIFGTSSFNTTFRTGIIGNEHPTVAGGGTKTLDDLGNPLETYSTVDHQHVTIFGTGWRVCQTLVCTPSISSTEAQNLWSIHMGWPGP
jgi:hypothetical protein